MDYRKLSDAEISALQSKNCSAEDWNNILVSNYFSHNHIQNVNFSGLVKIGAMSGCAIAQCSNRRQLLH